MSVVVKSCPAKYVNQKTGKKTKFIESLAKPINHFEFPFVNKNGWTQILEGIFKTELTESLLKMAACRQ